MRKTLIQLLFQLAVCHIASAAWSAGAKAISVFDILNSGYEVVGSANVSNFKGCKPGKLVRAGSRIFSCTSSLEFTSSQNSTKAIFVRRTFAEDEIPSEDEFRKDGKQFCNKEQKFQMLLEPDLELDCIKVPRKVEWMCVRGSPVCFPGKLFQR